MFQVVFGTTRQYAHIGKRKDATFGSAESVKQHKCLVSILVGDGDSLSRSGFDIFVNWAVDDMNKALLEASSYFYSLAFDFMSLSKSSIAAYRVPGHICSPTDVSLLGEELEMQAAKVICGVFPIMMGARKL